MTIEIQTEEFELAELYAHLTNQDLPEGINIHYEKVPKKGRGIEDEIFALIFTVGTIAAQEVVKEMVKHGFKKIMERAAAKPYIKVTMKDNQVEELPASMGDTSIASRLVELASTGNLQSTEFKKR